MASQFHSLPRDGGSGNQFYRDVDYFNFIGHVNNTKDKPHGGTSLIKNIGRN